ncbi:MAG: aldo/keto reductase [Bacillota bacterium]|nr:aldo/keto reductase [Bacillota bacterium]
MNYTKLGRTNLTVGRTGFGALPIQRVSFEEARLLLRKAFDNGVNFFDTARAYTNSEEKIGYSLSDIRKEIYIATKSGATDKKTFFEHIETSLKNLKTDYIDIIQLHNPDKLPDPKDPDGLYSALLEARQKGIVRFIGITSHKLSNALEAAESGLYDTVQFPLSSLSSDQDLKVVDVCKKNNVGLIAMKALSGGLITNAASSFAFLRQYENVVPIWGVQREVELDEILGYEKTPPELDDKMLEIIRKDREELSGSFCRGCGYCMPCPAGIQIPMAARMSLLLRRSPYQNLINEYWRENMELIEKCTQCNNCRNHCPYGLDTPNLLKFMLKDYREFYKEHI